MARRTDIDERVALFADSLPAVRRQTTSDIMLLGLVVVLGAVAIVGVLFAVPSYIVQAAVIGLVAASFAGVYIRMMTRPDHVRALQSDRILKIANESIAHLQEGLDPTTAEAVCRIVLEDSEAAAAAITDRDTVLGFAGVGEEHHRAGGPIITAATKYALDNNESRILHTKREIGCPEPACRLRAAIVVPLEVRDRPEGTLKLYYTSDRYLNETQLAMAEGLAQLLSTQLELAELERQTELATQMELKALQAQINPHFLFNTINTIAAFIRTDPEKARDLLRRFGTFYRRTLEQSEELVTVGLELEFLQTYVDLERARFGDRLNVTTDVDEGALDLALPAFVLQPLVENAVQHGMRPEGGVLNVKLTGRLEPDALCLTVADDGAGISHDVLPRVLEPGYGKGLGIALPNVHDRLKGFFGPESGLSIESTEGQGATVHLVISPLPKRDSSPAAATDSEPARA